MKRNILLFIVLFVSAVLPRVCEAQSSNATGTLTGRIFNPAKNEYVRDAQIRIAGTDLIAVSQSDGTYRISRIPTGEVTVSASFTGYTTTTGTVTVLPNQAVTLDLTLTTSASGEGSIVELDAFVVTDERAGNAKAIMRQRESMNIVTGLAADNFGDIPDGNVATFIKNLPGIDIETAGGVVDRKPRLRGLPGEYAGVTIDGFEPASADAADVNSRSFIFEQVSLNSMGSLEIHKTVSADQEANAPGGTIELKSKRAWERKGRHISLLASVNAHSAELHLGKRTYGPDDEVKRYRALPNAILEYSESFLQQRLGVVLNLSYASVFIPNDRGAHTYNYSPTAADPRPAVLSSVVVGRSQRANDTFSATFTTDFKATENLIFSFAGLYNYKDNEVRPYNVTFNTGGRTTVVGSDPLLSFTTSDAGGTGRSVSISNTTTSKYSESFTFMPRFEYRRGDLFIEGGLMRSDARSQYEEQKWGKMRAVTVNALTGVNFSAKRSSLTDADWKITQLSGPDWADPSNYKNPRVGDEERKATKELSVARVSASLDRHWAIPVTFKVGALSKDADHDSRDETAYLNSSYIGPGGGTAGSWGAHASPYVPVLDLMDSTITSTSGGSIRFLNHQSTRSLYLEHPEYFTPIGTAADYYTAFIANAKSYEEKINALFGMATSTIGKWRLRAGLRWEDTDTRSTEADPLPASAVVAAGYAVGANQRATTIPGLNFQYLSKPRVARPGGYDNFFPSASAKYSFRRNWELHLGYSRTIRRPSFSDVTGLFSIDESNLVITAPNPSLRPELSDNFSARLAYYFEPIGILGLDLYEYQISGSRTTTQLSAAEFGYGNHPVYSNYTFISGVSSGQKEWLRGMDLEYRQSLSFLPAPFNGLSVRASYGRNYASSTRALLSPHLVKAGLSYQLRRFTFNTAFRWSDDTPTNTTNTRYRRHNSDLDADATYVFSNRYSVFLNVKNIFDTPLIDMERPANTPDVSTLYIRGRTYLNLGFKAAF